MTCNDAESAFALCQSQQLKFVNAQELADLLEKINRLDDRFFAEKGTASLHCGSLTPDSGEVEFPADISLRRGRSKGGVGEKLWH